MKKRSLDEIEDVAARCSQLPAICNIGLFLRARPVRRTLESETSGAIAESVARTSLP